MKTHAAARGDHTRRRPARRGRGLPSRCRRAAGAGAGQRSRSRARFCGWRRLRRGEWAEPAGRTRAPQTPPGLPDGRRLAYAAPGEGGLGDVFVADANGTHIGAITHTDDEDETSPSWSPDGRRLVFEQEGKIAVVRADGSKPRILAQGEEPAWSPGGRRIAFQRAGDLFVVAAAGGRPRALTTSVSWELSPAWAPDGAGWRLPPTKDRRRSTSGSSTCAPVGRRG